MTDFDELVKEWGNAVWVPEPKDRYAKLSENDATVFAIAKTEVLLNAIKSGPFIWEDEAWLEETCAEIIALCLRAVELKSGPKP